MNSVITIVLLFNLLLGPLPAYSEATRKIFSDAKAWRGQNHVYIKKAACPFECCQFGKWHARESTAIYNAPNGEKIGRIQSGETVQGLTGEVHIMPAKVVVTYARTIKAYRYIASDPLNNEDRSFKVGDALYVLDYAGEGAINAWLQGEFLSLDTTEISGPGIFNFSDSKTPSWNCWLKLISSYAPSWWTKVKTNTGIIGWTKDFNADGMDGCGQ